MPRRRFALTRFSFAAVCVVLACATARASELALEFVEDRMELPPGFRVYRAAGAELCGGSYDIAFDGEGRLLVGDGQAVRRLADDDGDGLFDRFEVIAKGLGPRGPQGLLVYGDHLYAVGGDGIQVYRGYRTREGELEHAGRIGAPFSTGGDHAAHTIFRGHDDWLYFITGDGGGARDRVHITSETSPAREERAGTVFRISPDGKTWECIGTGGRNAPNLGQNELGDLFSLDSDMEWHVGLPWWRPVRLHHWVTGGDQGWQGVGAYPPYFIDNVPGIADVGRGSPDWGVFYEHTQLPDRYRGAFFVADYRWKSATTGGYATAGRLLVFFIERLGAGYRATWEVFAAPKPNARRGDGRPIDFALVDVEIGPDGSIYLSDHHQGIWRIIYDPDGRLTRNGAPPVARREVAQEDPPDPVGALLSIPQPQSERGRLRRESLRVRIDADWEPSLLERALDPAASLDRRSRAVRFLASGFERLATESMRRLASADRAEIRGQAAWLIGLRQLASEVDMLLELSRDDDAFVRRRALEALLRSPRAEDREGSLRVSIVAAVMSRLEDEDRLVRYVAMVALSRFPASAWLDGALALESLEARLRALVAADLRDEAPSPAILSSVVLPAIENVDKLDRSERLDLLRVLGRFRAELEREPTVREPIARLIVAGLGSDDPDLHHEHVRLAGEHDVAAAFVPLLDLLEREKNLVRSFHMAQALARISTGFSSDDAARALAWMIAADAGELGDGAGKGHQYPQFWRTVVSDFAHHHRALLVDRIGELDLAGRIGQAALDAVLDLDDAPRKLAELYERSESIEARRRVLGALGRARSLEADEILRRLFRETPDPEIEPAILIAIADRPPNEDNRSFLEEGVLSERLDVFCAAAIGLSKLRPRISEDIALFTIARMESDRAALRAGERLLSTFAGKHREGTDADRDDQRPPGDEEREAMLAHWKTWFRDTFGREHEPPTREPVRERTNEDLARFLLSDDAKGGEAQAGRRIYQSLCSRCHGSATPSPDDVLLGPDLRGATRRLSREEHVEALVWPSRTVAERFQGVAVQVRGGAILQGFVTESTDERLVLVDGDRVHTIPRSRIVFTTALETSIMPDGLLNRLPDRDLRHLVAFLESFGGEEASDEKRSEDSETKDRDKRTDPIDATGADASSSAGGEAVPIRGDASKPPTGPSPPQDPPRPSP